MRVANPYSPTSLTTPVLVLLVRHGVSEEDHPLGDRARQLTSEGITSFKRTSALIAKNAVGIRRILSSPYARAIATARILAEALHVSDLEVRDDLGATSASVRGVVKLAGDVTDAVALVGHNPTLTEAAASLLRTPANAVRFLPGTVAALERNADAFALRWVAGPGNRWANGFR